MKNILSTSITILGLLSCLSALAFVPSNIAPLSANHDAITKDIQSILDRAGMNSTSISMNVEENQKPKKNTVTVDCLENNFSLKVSAKPHEWAATTYLGLQKMGFLFPHPRDWAARLSVLLSHTRTCHLTPPITNSFESN